MSRTIHCAKRGASASAVLAASIFHFGTYTIESIKTYLAERGIAIRPARTAEAAR
mgnify:CR=1 FL=1